MKRMIGMLVLMVFMCLSTVVFAQNSTTPPQPAPEKAIAADKAAPAVEAAKDKKPEPVKKAVHKKHHQKAKKAGKVKKAEPLAPKESPK